MNEEEIVNRLLAARGIDTPQKRHAFLNPSYERDVHDPFLLPDIDKAVKRLVQARKNKEQVHIYGDYDVDGLSATSLLLDALSSFGLKLNTFIPNRFTDGYGLNKSALKKIKQQGSTVVITVDCGSSSVDEANYAKKIGLDLIITDHHNITSSTLPEAVAIINPKRQDSNYRFLNLAGVGVAFKLVQALQQATGDIDEGQEKWLLDLVALGTVADSVELNDENRTLTFWGLKVANLQKRPGIWALSQLSGLSPGQIKSYELGYIFAPRLNASGRLKSAKKALQLLTEKNKANALKIANELTELNDIRKSKQQAIEKEATRIAEQMDDYPVLVLSGVGWSHGIIGIVASRLMEKFKKPVFIMEEGEKIAKGSARSFGGFSASSALKELQELLISGGGHDAAAGFSLYKTDVEKFRIKINEIYAKKNLKNDAYKLKPQPDIRLNDLSGVTLKLTELLDGFEPFGPQNPKPKFVLSNISIKELKAIGRDRNHLSAWLIDKHGNKVRAVAFNMEKDELLGGDLIVSIFKNEFRGRSNVQAQIHGVI